MYLFYWGNFGILISVVKIALPQTIFIVPSVSPTLNVLLPLHYIYTIKDVFFSFYTSFRFKKKLTQNIL